MLTDLSDAGNVHSNAERHGIFQFERNSDLDGHRNDLVKKYMGDLLVPRTEPPHFGHRNDLI